MGCENAPPSNVAPIIEADAPIVTPYTLNPCGPGLYCFTIQTTSAIASVSHGTHDGHTVCAYVDQTTGITVTLTNGACPIPALTAIPYTLDVECIILPLAPSSIHLDPGADGIYIRYTTTTPPPHVVMHSVDGYHYRPIAEAQGGQWMDRNPSEGINYYIVADTQPAAAYWSNPVRLPMYNVIGQQVRE
jgi:hypothetical protein